MAFSKTHLIIRGYLRKAFRASPVYKEFMDSIPAQRRGRAVLRQCQRCGEWTPRNKMDLDHIIPAVDPEQGFVDWNTFIARLIEDVTPDTLALLCRFCHQIKVKQENTVRAKTRKSKKST